MQLRNSNYIVGYTTLTVNTVFCLSNSNVIFKYFKVSQVRAKYEQIVTVIRNFSFRFYVRYSFETLEILSFFIFPPLPPPRNESKIEI